MRVLFVSKYFPVDFATTVHGVFQRLRMFLDAIKTIGQTDVLFYVPTDVDVSPRQATRPLTAKILKTSAQLLDLLHVRVNAEEDTRLRHCRSSTKTLVVVRVVAEHHGGRRMACLNGSCGPRRVLKTFQARENHTIEDAALQQLPDLATDRLLRLR